ncbi:MAG: hypothetical protein CMF99_03405 [Candidatus Marinimicrobia bacterium]|nr:hypothetical protein [Candidatus Neomarinimicrobiota bacterium]|tara:strand:- start:520 stop:987 length:468 start_codon:yes stop_codon:yes gene_type:complete
MPTKPEEKAPENNGEDQGSTLDPQKKYLMDQFGNLMEKVGDGFGGPLQEELIKRLEQTIADFHEEVSEMMASLKENAEKRHEKLKEIWNNPDASLEVGDNQGSKTENTEPEGEMSEWERKLEEAGKLGDSDSSDSKPEVKEEPPKKKGLFGRKKK